MEGMIFLIYSTEIFDWNSLSCIFDKLILFNQLKDVFISKMNLEKVTILAFNLVEEKLETTGVFACLHVPL